MPFKIMVTETKTETKLVRGEWVVLEVINGDEHRGYAPDREKEVKSDTEVYSQVVERLDLTSVIAAVNGVGFFPPPDHK